MIPLCIDLDGTLIRGDTSRLAAFNMLSANPFTLLLMPFWLLKGLAGFKREIAKRASIDPAALPYNKKFLEWVQQQKTLGRELILISATDQKFADAVGDYLPIFDKVIASDGVINLRSKNKRDKLISLYGSGQYDYAGNDYPDIAVWQTAHKAIVVNAPQALVAQCKCYPNIGEIFE
jgi:phosphoserine phosphatase